MLNGWTDNCHSRQQGTAIIVNAIELRITEADIQILADPWARWEEKLTGTQEDRQNVIPAKENNYNILKIYRNQ